jgi:hypothetical protein
VFQVSAQQIVEDVVPGTRASFAEGGGPDKRSYQVDRSKIVRVLQSSGLGGRCAAAWSSCTRRTLATA